MSQDQDLPSEPDTSEWKPEVQRQIDAIVTPTNSPTNAVVVDEMAPENSTEEPEEITIQELSDKVGLGEDALRERLEEIREVGLVQVDSDREPFTYCLTQNIYETPDPTETAETSQNQQQVTETPATTAQQSKGDLPVTLHETSQTDLAVRKSTAEWPLRVGGICLGLTLLSLAVFGHSVIAALFVMPAMLFSAVGVLRTLCRVGQKVPVIGSVPYALRGRVHNWLDYDCSCQHSV